MILGEMICELRKMKGIKQKDLADLLHVSVGTISNYETGVHIPDLDNLIILANYFHVSVDYLLGLTKFEYPVNTLEKKFTENISFAQLYNKLFSLSPHSRNMLIEYLGLIQLKEQQDESKK